MFHPIGDAGMIGSITGMRAVTTPFTAEPRKKRGPPPWARRRRCAITRATWRTRWRRTSRTHATRRARCSPTPGTRPLLFSPMRAARRGRSWPMPGTRPVRCSSDARDKAAPYVSEARDRINSDVIPAVKDAIAALDDATEDARAEAKKRGKAVAAAAKGEVEAPGSKHRVRKVLIALGLGGIAFAVAKRLGGQQPSTNWQSSYTPPPAPVPPPARGPVAGGADDIAASTPGEAASDAADAAARRDHARPPGRAGRRREGRRPRSQEEVAPSRCSGHSWHRIRRHQTVVEVRAQRASKSLERRQGPCPRSRGFEALG